MIREYNIHMHRVLPKLLLDTGELGCFCQLLKFLGCGVFGKNLGTWGCSVFVLAKTGECGFFGRAHSSL